MTLINREDAIDELRHLIPYKKYHKGEWVHLLDKREVFKALNALPSADAVSRENCDQCKIDQVGVLEQQLAELRGDYETLKKAYEEALSNDVEWIPITTSEPTTSNHVLVTYKWGEDDYETSELDYWVTKCAAEEGNKQCQMFIDHVIAWSFMPQPYKEI